MGRTLKGQAYLARHGGTFLITGDGTTWNGRAAGIILSGASRLATLMAEVDGEDDPQDVLAEYTTYNGNNNSSGPQEITAKNNHVFVSVEIEGDVPTSSATMILEP